MNSFLDFILNDIEAKKTLLSSMPINNKTNIKKYNEKLASIYENYEYYKESVLNYLKAKCNSFDNFDNINETDKLVNEFNELKYIKFMFNPMNSHKEKLGIDNLLYDIRHYSNFTFDEINSIIKKLVDKFTLVGVSLKSSDFKYTCYVNEYMDAFFGCNSNYDKLSDVFEKIYWYNPNIIEHIELNFRKLLKKYDKNFSDYVKKQQEVLLSKNNFSNYDTFIVALKDKYNEVMRSKEEDLSLILDMAKRNEIDINNYFADSKFRMTTFANLTINPIDYNDPVIFNKLLDSLRRLRNNVLEYNNYLKFLPLFNYFKEKYEKQDSKENILSSLKNIESSIATKESKLEGINNKIFGSDKGGFGFFKKENNESIKNLKIESLKIAKELYDLYYEKDKLEFEEKVITLKNDQLLLISDVVRLYYSFNYFKKDIFKEIFKLDSYDEVVKLCDEFDEFASNPSNIIINGINTFEDSDIGSVISNKYKLENISISNDDLDEDNLIALKNKIDFVFRINKIENSELSIEKIWFVVQVCKILSKEEKNNAKKQ